MAGVSAFAVPFAQVRISKGTLQAKREATNSTRVPSYERRIRSHWLAQGFWNFIIIL